MLSYKRKVLLAEPKPLALKYHPHLERLALIYHHIPGKTRSEIRCWHRDQRCFLKFYELQDRLIMGQDPKELFNIWLRNPHMESCSKFFEIRTVEWIYAAMGKTPRFSKDE